MTIELNSTLAQAEVLFLSFSQLVADIDRRKSEGEVPSPASVLRHRGPSSTGSVGIKMTLPQLSENLRELLKAGR